MSWYCVDCGKKKDGYVAARCRSCGQKKRIEEGRGAACTYAVRPAFNLCVDCGQKIDRYAARCAPCNNKRLFSRPLEERFWEKVAKGSAQECWEWQASCRTGGYGQIKSDGGLEGAHRVSWKIHYGSIPTGLSVLHKCDNPKCVNPYHLFLGSQDDNMKDAALKERTNAKLDGDKVRAIRDRYAQGDITQQQLANDYGVSRSAINRAIRGIYWGHI